MKPIRVFIASTEAEWLPARVLEFSIRDMTSLPVELRTLYSFRRDIPLPRDIDNRPRTPFSFQRFLIPELCGYEGKAIYMDADMQVFGDLRELWGADFAGYDLLTVADGGSARRPQFSVMLLDCGTLAWRIENIVERLDAGELDYASLMYDMRVARSIGRTLPATWNSLEHFEPGQTRLLHYTDMNTQPWISRANPLGHLWVGCLRRAIDDGFMTMDELRRETAAGHIRPSLAAQIFERMDDPLALPASMRALDRGFVAPYKRMNTGKARPWTTPAAAVRALLRRLYFHSPFARRSRHRDST
jgi:hypothetical protein